jgi:LysR family transcriptional regulator for bpeEF and oprC
MSTPTSFNTDIASGRTELGFVPTLTTVKRSPAFAPQQAFGHLRPRRISSGRNQQIYQWVTGVFRTSDIEQMRMGVLEHLGIAQAPAWLFAAELREGTVIRLLTPFERIVPILAVRPASRRLSTKVRIFIEHLEKTFALCSQFNPPR